MACRIPATWLSGDRERKSIARTGMNARDRYPWTCFVCRLPAAASTTARTGIKTIAPRSTVTASLSPRVIPSSSHNRFGGSVASSR